VWTAMSAFFAMTAASSRYRYSVIFFPTYELARPFRSSGSCQGRLERIGLYRNGRSRI